MTDESQEKETTSPMGPFKQYSTAYTWTVYHWSLIHDSAPIKRSATSSRFKLHGTPGYTCTLSLCAKKSDWDFVVEFSDTLGIEKMVVDVCDATGNMKFLLTPEKPIPKRLKRRMEGKMDHNHANYILRYSKDTIKIDVRVTIVKESDVVSCPNPTTVSPVISTNDSPLQNIPAKLKSMFEEKSLCDVTFLLGDKKCHAHKVVLAAQSKIFETMFSNCMAEQKDIVIDVADKEAKVFQKFLDYLYSGEVTELETVVEAMIVIADFYDVPHLKNICENFMLKSISENSVIRYLILADKLNCETLKNEALCFVRANATVFEKALLVEDVATVMGLREVLSKNQPKQ